MRNVLRSAALAACVVASSAFAAPSVDGIVGAGEYGAATAVVGTDAAAPVSNFGAPTNVARAGYDIFLTSANDTLFGAFAQTGGVSDGSFLNLYFDIDPATGTGGSDLGIEVTNLRGFVPGQPGYFDLSSFITFATTTVGGLTTTEFSIANEAFRQYIAAAEDFGLFGPGGYTQQDVRLNLSQSLSYSVAGGTTYGADRLGTFSVAAVPEPATWAMMIGGVGLVGGTLRRRAAKTLASA